MNRPLLLFAIPIFLCSNYSFSQDEENENCNEPPKPVMKLMKVAENEKEHDRERTMAFSEAVEAAPNNAYVYFAFGNFNWGRVEKAQEAMNRGTMNMKSYYAILDGTAKMYKKVIENCPEYHSDAYYKLGVIYLEMNDKGQAAKYLKKFVEFDSPNRDAYGENYSKQKADVEQLLPEMEFFDKFFNNPVPYEPTEVKNVASKKDEYLPMISPDNELLFFTRKGEREIQTGIINPIIEEFTVAHRPNMTADFDSGDPLKPPFNTPKYKNYGGVTMSLDNKEMFICACQEVEYQQHANCDLYVTRFERAGTGGYDYSWTELENLGPAINTKDGWEAQPTLSADGHTLYFASWREGSDLTDIYYSERGDDGKWSQAQKVPGPINSPGHDKAPFLHQDSETMYFVSDVNLEPGGRAGGGGSDIFYTRMEDGKWTEPKNLGYPINTKGNEVGIVVSTDGKLAYFTSRNAGSNGYDIYYFELYEEARPQEVMMVKGEAKTEDGTPISDATVEVSVRNSDESVEVHVNGDDGKFAAIVKLDKVKEEDVMITMKKEGFSFDTQLIKNSEIKKIARSEDVSMKGLDMEIQPIQVGEAFTIDNILYATASYDLSDDAKFVLDQFAKFLNENPTVKVTIEGHTDNRGDAGANKTLSANRAKGVLDYIVSKGVAASRLKSEGFGQTKPKVPNDSDANRALNRRTDIRITSM